MGANAYSTMASAAADRERLELLLLHRGIIALQADRTSCDDCGRTPLVGEQVHVYGGRRPRTVCELCSARHEEQPQVQRRRPSHRARADRAPARHAPPSRGPLASGQRAATGAGAGPAIDPPRPRWLIKWTRFGPGQRLDRRLRSPRAGLRLPAGHRQPPRVHRPLPGRMAPHADRLGRPRGRGPLSREGAGQPLQLGGRDLRRGGPSPPDRRDRADRQGQPGAHARRLRAGRRSRRHARHASRSGPSRPRWRTGSARASAGARGSNARTFVRSSACGASSRKAWAAGRG